MQTLQPKQRLMILISGIFVELIIGTVYAYSVIRVFLENELQLTHTESSIPYLTSLAVFALMVMVTGRYMTKRNFLLFLITGILLIGLGYIISAFATHYLIFTLSYGLMIGSGVGILYSIPIQIIQTVYDKNQGLAVGLTVGGFGLSTVITAPLLQMLFSTQGFSNTLIIFGISSLIILSLLMYFLLNNIHVKLLYKRQKEVVYHANKKMFSLFFVIFMIGIMFGLSMIGLTGYIGIEYFGLSISEISLFMILFASCNGLSRPLFGFIYDKFGLKFSIIFLSMITILIAALYTLFNLNTTLMFVVTISLSWATVGGWLSLMPIITKDVFGKNSFNRTYGNMYLSYGFAAVLGNLYTSAMIDANIALNVIFIPVMILSLLVIATMLIANIKIVKTL